jgi:hypothetical protein
VVGGVFNPYRNNTAALHALFEQRIVVLQEKLQELLLVSPLDFVVALLGVGLVSRSLRQSTLGRGGCSSWILQ